MASQRTALFARRGGENDPPRHASEFLNHFATQELERRMLTWPAPLSAEEHSEHRKQLQGICFISPKYWEATEINVGRIQAEWKQFCTKMKDDED